MEQHLGFLTSPPSPHRSKRATDIDRKKKRNAAAEYFHGACDSPAHNQYIEALWQWNQWNEIYQALPDNLQAQLTDLRLKITLLYDNTLDE